MEVKHLNLSSVEIKADGDGGYRFSGYASKFDGVDSYGDSIVAGAYKDTLANRDRPVMLKWNHYGPVIGKYLTIEEDDQGLLVEGELTKGHRQADDTAALLNHRAISGLSIGYYVKDYEMKDDIRYLKSIELIEISVVEQPADNQAHITDLKSATKYKDVEKFLRQKFSNTEATAIVAAVKKLHGEREQENQQEETLNLLNNFTL